jgi:eukaryotic-like serine/threonine-protein kinase
MPDQDHNLDVTSVASFRTHARGDDAAGIPERIGPYRIVAPLGNGSMSSVFLAEQTGPLTRQVALKVMRSRFLDSEGRIRFEAERQAMARLQHPNVAQIFEADTTEEGHPYFAMEHVAGDRITTYCDARQLSIDERLELFRDVCAGVQHAHQKGIIHRDLKPSNILVAETDGGPIPKIIDFGIAKALDHPPDAMGVTGDRLIGTPAYLSPEAAAMGEGGLDVDTRSDVYSLGVVLYELLVGHRPYDGNNLFKVLQRVAVGQAPEPSKRWSQLDVTTRDAVAERRKIESGALCRSLRGDLDWIVGKAIAKDREQRYGSAAELAADIGRHLRHELGTAGPPSTLYRLKKLVRRRLGAVVSALLVALALAGGFVARTLEARRANREAAAAIAARPETEQALKEAERARRETAEVADFLAGIFKLSDPGEAKGSAVTARELLDTAAEEIHGFDFSGEPLTHARFLQTIADIYRKLGLFDTAKQFFEEALRIRRQELPADHLDVAESLNGLAALHAQLGEFGEAEPLFEAALAIREKALGADDLKIAMSLNNLANVYVDLGKVDQAETLFTRSLAIVEKHDDLPSADHLVGLANLASLYLEQQRYQEAEPLLRTFIARQKAAFGAMHPHVAIALENLADLRAQLGAVDEAEDLYHQALAILEQVYDPDHPEVAYCLSSLAGLYARQGAKAEAERLYRRALAIQEAKLPADHPERRATVEGLAALLESR